MVLNQNKVFIWTENNLIFYTKDQRGGYKNIKMLFIILKSWGSWGSLENHDSEIYVISDFNKIGDSRIIVVSDFMSSLSLF